MARGSSRAPKEVEATIETLNAEGLGQATLNERELLVRNALPGETLVARVLKKRRGRLYADGVALAADSDKMTHADRVAPACTYFPRCGGCSLHHLAHPAQLAHKRAQLASALAAQGVAVGQWQAPVSKTRLGYRRKARLGVRQLGEQVLVGFRESFSNRVARIDHCAVLTPEVSALLAPLKLLLADLTIAAQVPQIEVAQGDDRVVLMLRHLAPCAPADVEKLVAFERLHGVQFLLQSGGYDTLRQLDGAPPSLLHYNLADYGLMLEFHPAQFTQVNPRMNEALIRTVIAHLGGYKSRAISSRRIADLFCGIGNITLPLARAGAAVYGYEAAADAIEMARHNAGLNGLEQRTQFAVADLYTENFRLPDVDTLVLDPPRSGAGPYLPAWLEGFNGRDIVYVSCNPATFASDAGILDAAGWMLERVGIFDMFPHTAHVETIGHFVPRQ